MGIEKHLQLRNRTKAFALRVIRMSQVLPKGREANVIAHQLLRSATSMAANYRAVGRARSKAEFVLSWVSLLRSRMRQFSGSNFWPKVA
jgi:23S rRNA-intervening sequence protein